jgi:hypothetical protein
LGSLGAVTETSESSYFVDLDGFPEELDHVHDLDSIIRILFGSEFYETISLSNLRRDDEEDDT